MLKRAAPTPGTTAAGRAAWNEDEDDEPECGAATAKAEDCRGDCPIAPPPDECDKPPGESVSPACPDDARGIMSAFGVELVDPPAEADPPE